MGGIIGKTSTTQYEDNKARQAQLNVKDNKSRPAQINGRDNKSMPAQIMDNKSMPAQIMDNKSRPAQIRDNKSRPAQINRRDNKSRPAHISGSSFMWLQPYQRCGYLKTHYKKLFTHGESHASAKSLLESGEQRYIKSTSTIGRIMNQGQPRSIGVIWCLMSSQPLRLTKQ